MISLKNLYINALNTQNSLTEKAVIGYVLDLFETILPYSEIDDLDVIESIRDNTWDDLAITSNTSFEERIIFIEGTEIYTDIKFSVYAEHIYSGKADFDSEEDITNLEYDINKIEFNFGRKNINCFDLTEYKEIRELLIEKIRTYEI